MYKDFVFDRLENTLPGIGGRNKVPQVRFTTAKVINRTVDTCELIVIFEEPVTPQYQIKRYKIYIQNLYGDQWVSVGETTQSPFRLVIPNIVCKNKSVAICVQTILDNGFSSDINQAATTALTL